MSERPDYSEKFSRVDLTLISSFANETEGRVLMHGDSKYARRSYLDTPGYDVEAFRALLRHVAAIMQGEQYDEETGQHHLAHIRANTGIILECWASHNEEPSAGWPHEPAKPKATEPAPPKIEVRLQCRCGRRQLKIKAPAPLLIPQSRSCD